MTVEINTITRVLRPASQMSCKGRRHDYPRSIVTDQEPTLEVNLGSGMGSIICWILTGDNLLGLLPGLLK